MLQEAEIHSDHVQFSTLSPILIENKQGEPVHPHQIEYVQEFGYYAALRIRELAGREPYRPITIQPLNMKRVVIKETNSTFRQLNTAQKQLHFTAYRGQFMLKGHTSFPSNMRPDA
ncbi:CRISPR-associated endoribonuclease Cas6 [Paenibacillus sp. SGZ-1009]|uniref:CRISPR-associated endoribonuclease Cas6 n=1 Tax=Paenibacillus campi TaxID=3106031 RepID=UPI002AFE23BF|nr:CRISPR-associated endoribonuclease Cas6 [Paenibacillus sp. SGZ-1009]